MKKQIPALLKNTQLFFFLLLFGCNFLNAQLTNGNFESGGSGTGFLVTDYTLINPLTGTSNPGFYARTTNPALMNSTFIAGGDHTTGTGNMLVIDGATATNKFFWTTGSTGGTIPGFTAGLTYTFSYWIKSVSNQVTDDATRANISVFFVNANNINPTALNHLAPLPANGWEQVSYSFVATNTNVLIRLKTISTAAVGNDFAIDDVSITTGALPFTGTYASINPTCPSTTDGSIVVSLSGGFLPYTSYSLTGAVTQTNTNGIFSNLPAGTYNVSVTDATGQPYSQSNIVLSAANDLVVSGPVTICSGQLTQLTVSGGNSTYNWTSSPIDASIVNPTNATQTVSPTTTTTYTVTSGTPSSPTELITNGDFSSGIIGFTTEYTQIDNPNPFGVQSAYNIVTNPAAWFTPFSSCGDHTSGSGYLMVFDGATIGTGDVKAWCTASSITVQPNKSYTFSYYVAAVSSGTPARLEPTINGVSLGAPTTAPSNTCTWTLNSYTWDSGTNTTADLCIYDRESSQGGNDFALDDLSFKETVTCIYQKSVVVTVTPPTTPTFSPVAAICSGVALSALPTTSNNGITGTWSPGLNNTATTTYTFTPTTGQCATTAPLAITVNQTTTPTFTAVAPICSGSTTAALPTTSTNGYTGAWSPEVNNTATTTYTFTPDTGQCTTTASLQIEVNQLPQFMVSGACNGSSYTLSAVGADSSATYVWLDSTNTQIGTDATVVITGPGTYSLTLTQKGCSNNQPITVASTLCGIQKGISANNDGLNDDFDLAGFNVSDLKIFNRYGMEVYTKANYNNEWHGQSDKGDELPDGTYYYVINFQDLPSKIGWIYINRAQ